MPEPQPRAQPEGQREIAPEHAPPPACRSDLRADGGRDHGNKDQQGEDDGHHLCHLRTRIAIPDHRPCADLWPRHADTLKKPARDNGPEAVTSRGQHRSGDKDEQPRDHRRTPPHRVAHRADEQFTEGHAKHENGDDLRNGERGRSAKLGLDQEHRGQHAVNCQGRQRGQRNIQRETFDSAHVRVPWIDFGPAPTPARSTSRSNELQHQVASAGKP